ncbi:hypothetical protein ANRL4_03796 [Anaerolineae bacterium]|nr:hypothetical protein ANRL4_03796 [Anaerolineae bacterium]
MSNVKSHRVVTSGRQLTAICLDDYDRTSTLSADEQAALHALVVVFAAQKFKWPPVCEHALTRLLCPVGDVLQFIDAPQPERVAAVRQLVRAMHDKRTPYWAWDTAQWATLFTITPRTENFKVARRALRSLAYWLGSVRRIAEVDDCRRYDFARRVFGARPVDAAVEAVVSQVRAWGYYPTGVITGVREVLCEWLLVNGSAQLEALPANIVQYARPNKPPVHYDKTATLIARVLVSRRYTQQPVLVPPPKRTPPQHPATEGAHPEWVNWTQRWMKTSTLARSSVKGGYYSLLRVGRWLATTHPEVTSPAQWTRELAVEFVAAVSRMTIGDFVSSQQNLPQVGKALSASSQKRLLCVLTTFIRNCQEWGWIDKVFSPERCLVVPRSLNTQLRPNPRVIHDAAWAKLVWAGLNLTTEDLNGQQYPIEAVRAMTLVWLFGGLRNNEICRLRVGCVHWDGTDATDLDAASTSAICLLDVPVNKTSGAFTKPIARLAGQAVLAWEAVRPSQPRLVDAKTGEQVHLLFAYRGKRMGEDFINHGIIPALCRKAGLPLEDARGRLSSHRARATIATQLANAKDPMTLLELQQWLGHSTPLSTQFYVKVTPTRLSHAYADAGYLDRNIRAIEVLVDQDAVRSGAAATGEAWKYYDVGHGHCTYDFFDQCPHRMACAKCDFYIPKDSARAQLLQAKANLLRMKQEIPLLDDELEALDSDVSAIDRLCQKLADVPTPAGPTPNQLHGTSAFVALSDIN